jgi:hypothetical protein
MCDVRLLVGNISIEVLMFHRLVAEPEELLGEDEAPNEGTSCQYWVLNVRGGCVT